MTRFEKTLRSSWDQWCEFWFGSTAEYSAAAFRVMVSVVLLLMYVSRHFEWGLFLSDGGFMPAELAKTYWPAARQPFFYWYPSSDLAVYWTSLGFLFSLVLLMFGLLGQWTTWLCLLLHLALLQRNPTIIYGADLVATFWLFYLGFIRHNQYFSLWPYFKLERYLSFKKKPQKPQKERRNSNGMVVIGSMASSMGMRLVQIQLCIIYAYTGWEKLKGIQWWEGTALWQVIGNEQLAPFDMSFLQNFPVIVAVMTFMTLIFEIYFPVMIWGRKTQGIWLLLGLILHLGAALIMGLVFFSMVMLSAYLMFVPEYRLRQWTSWVKRPELTH